MMTDPIADMLCRIKNANQRKHKTVDIPYSNLKSKIVQLLLDEGYITEYKIVNTKTIKKYIQVTLKYKGKLKTITGLRRISKPGLRVYSDYSTLPRVLNGLGIAIISTSKGIMADKGARQSKLGGEVIAYVW